MSAASAASASAVCSRSNSPTQNDSPHHLVHNPVTLRTALTPCRYESQKREDWSSFLDFIRNQNPPLRVSCCREAQVIEFLKHLDQFGDTKIHIDTCQFFGLLLAPASCDCGCPVRQAYRAVEAIIGRLREAFEENVGQWKTNPFCSCAVRMYVAEMKDKQDKSKGMAGFGAEGDRIHTSTSYDSSEAHM